MDHRKRNGFMVSDIRGSISSNKKVAFRADKKLSARQAHAVGQSKAGLSSAGDEDKYHFSGAETRIQSLIVSSGLLLPPDDFELNPARVIRFLGLERSPWRLDIRQLDKTSL